MNLTTIDWLIMLLYFVFVLGIGFALKRFMKTSKDFLQAGRSLPAWICGLAFISANLGAQEVIGMGASGAKYGIVTSHFYWIGAIPAMIFVGVFMMPFYYGSKARSVPEFLRLRFDEKTRAWNACSFAAMTVFSSGISMYAMARLIQTLHVFDKLFIHLGMPVAWIFHFAIILSAVIVLCYIFLGGLTSAIYNEVLQFFLIWAGALLIPILGLYEAGGWGNLKLQIINRVGEQYVHVWAGVGTFANNPMGINWFGIVFGLGAVISMGYWTTDFLVVQRILAAKDIRSAEMAPIIGAGFKMMVPFIVILPGLLGLAVLPEHLVGADQASATGSHSYNEVLPIMLARYCGPGLLGLGITALMAGFMSGMAGNVSAFATVWTYDIYRPFFRKEAPDAHYVSVGRWCTLLGVLVSIGTAYFVMQFHSIMDYVQALFSFFVAPLFGTVLLGMLWRRTTPAGGFWGLLSGTCSAIGLWAWVKINPAALQYVALSPKAKDMAENMYRALWSWIVCVIVTVVVSYMTRPKPVEELTGLVYGYTKLPSESGVPVYQRPIFWACVVGVVFVILNIIFW